MRGSSSLFCGADVRLAGNSAQQVRGLCCVGCAVCCVGCAVWGVGCAVRVPAQPIRTNVFPGRHRLLSHGDAVASHLPPPIHRLCLSCPVLQAGGGLGVDGHSVSVAGCRLEGGHSAGVGGALAAWRPIHDQQGALLPPSNASDGGSNGVDGGPPALHLLLLQVHVQGSSALMAGGGISLSHGVLLSMVNCSLRECWAGELPAATPSEVPNQPSLCCCPPCRMRSCCPCCSCCSAASFPGPFAALTPHHPLLVACCFPPRTRRWGTSPWRWRPLGGALPAGRRGRTVQRRGRQQRRGTCWGDRV